MRNVLEVEDVKEKIDREIERERERERENETDVFSVAAWCAVQGSLERSQEQHEPQDICESFMWKSVCKCECTCKNVSTEEFLHVM